MVKTLPEAFKERMAAQLGTEYDAFISAYELPPVRGIRINTLKISKERFIELCPWKIEQSPTLDEGLILREEAPHIGSHPFHIAGLFYVQEPAAMSVIAAADIRPGMRVLDLCAAPGGKSGGIAARLGGSGFILSNEIVPSRAKQLARNLERLGVVNAAVTSAHPDVIADALPRFFDRVIVDAPCSGEGLFRKDDTAIAEWSPEHVVSCAARQKSILESAEKCVADGGRLVYSTCTFSPEENEGVIEAFLDAHSDYSLVSQKRLYPHTCAGEGHFVAVLEKSGSFQRDCNTISAFKPSIVGNDKDSVLSRKPAKRGGASPWLAPLGSEQKRIASDFLSGVCILEDNGVLFDSLYALNDRLIYAPFDIPSSVLRLRTVSLGVEIGEFTKGRLKPSHTFFMAAHGFCCRNRIELSGSSGELAAFLRGETIETDAALDIRGEHSRYLPICCGSFPVGFGKLSDGVIKNHLPKGLLNARIGTVLDE